jgi:hypothetical protein
MHEHEQLEKYVVNTHVLVAAPDGPEEHDDYPCSAMLACWGEKMLESALMPEIQVSSGAKHQEDFEIRRSRGRRAGRRYGG